MKAVLRQAWWAPIAALMAAIQLVLLPVLFGFGNEDSESRLASLVIAVVGGAITALGLWRRPSHRPTGNGLLLVGCGFAAFWFWTLYLPILAIVVAVGVLTSGWRTEPTIRTA